VPFHHFWPDMGWAEFCNSTDRLLQVACMMLHFICIRCGPGVCATLLDIERHPARKDAVKKYAALVCQLAPLLLFYVVVMCLDV
ncbi:unnamed protein product, partial [Symbiodinium sp. KB8]